MRDDHIVRITRKATGRALAVATIALTPNCSQSPPIDSDGPFRTQSQTLMAGNLSSAAIQLSTLTNSCGLNQVQDFFQIVNGGQTRIAVSDITIKFWVNETSAAKLVPQINTGGCLTNSSGCFHQVAGVKAQAVPFAPACGSDTNHQANWEVTVANADPAQLAPGQKWDNLQVALHMSNYANFTPGTNTWYSPCLTSKSYANSNRFAVHYKGDLVFASGLAAPSCRAPHGHKQLQGHVTSSMAAAPLVGPVPPSTVMEISLGLPPRDEENLSQIAKAVSDPASPSYRHYVSPEQFGALYGPLTSDYEALATWAEAMSLSVAHRYPNRLALGVRGTVADIERALFVNMNYYLRPDGTQFFAPDREPSLDVDPSSPIDWISDLSDFVQPVLDLAYGAGTFREDDFRTAYADCTNLTGTGQCMGIASITDYDPRDIELFKSQFRHHVTGTVTPFYVDPPLKDRRVYWALTETMTDIEMALYMAPGADVVVYIGDSRLRNLEQMASDPRQCKQLNSTSGSVSTDDDLSIPRILRWVLPLQGQSYSEASGDNGYSTNTHGGNPDNDRVSYVTKVGGTILSLGTILNPGYVSEVPWHCSGSVLYTQWPTPDYQKGFVTGGRTIPDIAMVSDGATIVTTFYPPGLDGRPDTGGVPRQGTVITSSGTSISSPLWVGFMALVNQWAEINGWPSVGFANPALYTIARNKNTYANGFHDIQSRPGFDDGVWRCHILANDEQVEDELAYPATAGYDIASGLGSPTCGLIGELAGEMGPRLDVSLLKEFPAGTYKDLGVAAWAIYLLNRDGNVEEWLLANIAQRTEPNRVLSGLGGFGFVDIDFALGRSKPWDVLAASDALRKIVFSVGADTQQAADYPDDVTRVAEIAGIPQSNADAIDVYITIPDPVVGGVKWLRRGSYVWGSGKISWDPKSYGDWMYRHGLFARQFGGRDFLMAASLYTENTLVRWLPPDSTGEPEIIFPFTTHAYSKGDIVDNFEPDAIDYSSSEGGGYYGLDTFSSGGVETQCLVRLQEIDVSFPE